MTELKVAVRRATMALAEAGIASAPVDALQLAAHLLGEDVTAVRRLMVVGSIDAPVGYEELVRERASRVPLQHLTGRAYFRRLTLDVGPGVFVPRPETELVVELALRALSGVERPVVIDLCSGSGAIAFSIKDEAPGSRVYAVELSELAHAWAVRNRERLDLDVVLECDDATTGFEGLEARVDVVVANPPYIPVGSVPVDAEVRDHDPEMALFGGSDDGVAIPLAVAARAAELLRPGGTLVIEHADVQGRAMCEALAGTGSWLTVIDHADLLGRPRCAVAVRAG